MPLRADRVYLETRLTIESDLLPLIDDPETQWSLERDVLDWARSYGDDRRRAWLECERADYGIALAFVSSHAARAVAEEALEVAREVAPLLEGEQAEWAHRVLARPPLAATAEDQQYEDAMNIEAGALMQSLGATAERLTEERSALAAPNASLVRVEAEIERAPNAEYLRLSHEIHACLGAQQGVQVIACAMTATLQAAFSEKLPQKPPAWNEMARELARAGRRAHACAFSLAATVMDRAAIACGLLTMKSDARETLELAILQSTAENRFAHAHAIFLDRLQTQRADWLRKKMVVLRSELGFRSLAVRLASLRAKTDPGETADVLDAALAVVQARPVDRAALAKTVRMLKEKFQIDEGSATLPPVNRPN